MAAEPLSMVGVKDALRTLNDVDKKLRRQITEDYLEIIRPLKVDAEKLVPDKPPLSGMARSWTPRGSNYEVLPFSPTKRAPQPPGYAWQQSRAGRRRMSNWLKWKAGIKGFISGKKPREYNGYMKNVATFGVKWQGPASVLFDTSHKARTPQGAIMVARLTSRFGEPSRVMWRAYGQADEDIQREMRQLCARIIRESNDRLKAYNRTMRAIRRKDQ